MVAPWEGGQRAWHCGDRGVQVGGGGLSLGSHTGFRPESPTRGPGLWPRLPSPKFRVFPAFGWGWGGRGSLGAPGPRGDQRRRRERGPAVPRLGGRGAWPHQESLAAGRGGGAADPTGANGPLSVFSALGPQGL